MPRGKKVPVESEDSSSNEEVVKKTTKKPVKKEPKKAPKKETKKVVPEEENSEEVFEDELSDIDVNDDTTAATNNVQKSKPSTKHNKPNQNYDVDSACPIGELKVTDILNYLVQKGIETSNPVLKYGAINLKKEINGTNAPKRFTKPSYNQGQGQFPPQMSGQFMQQFPNQYPNQYPPPYMNQFPTQHMPQRAYTGQQNPRGGRGGGRGNMRRPQNQQTEEPDVYADN